MQTDNKNAILYRMVMTHHVCPFGLKSKHLLESHGYQVDDRHLQTREETDAFKAAHGVSTTPQTFIADVHIGGHTELREYLGKKVLRAGDAAYTPVLAIFAVSFLLALAVGVLTSWSMGYVMLIPHFISLSIVLLALMKLRDVEAFSTMFLNYDVLAQRWVPYSYVYPYAELLAGLLMFAGVLPFVSAPIALFIGLVGAWSVLKAVYIEKRELKCACAGGNTHVPLGFLSLTENLFMVGMAISVLFFVS
jgi:glutaredoxin